MTQSGACIEHYLTAQTGVNHYAHAFNRDGCLGDRCCYYNLALARCRWGDGATLVLWREVAVKGVYGEVVRCCGGEVLRC